MDINSKIEEIFSDFIVDGIKIPIFFMNYEGKASSYLTYYTWLSKPLFFSDNDYQEEVSHATIDVWSKRNFKNIINSVKWELKMNGFTWIDNGPETYESDTKYFHIPVNFYVESSQLVNKH